MIVYESTKWEFMDSVVSGSIADEIYDIFLEKIGRTTNLNLELGKILWSLCIKS